MYICTKTMPPMEVNYLNISYLKCILDECGSLNNSLITIFLVTVTETESEDSVCLQPKKPGPCKARMERFYFDQKTKSCKEFIYGGCQRNDNNFKTQEECEEKCYN